MIWIHRYPHLKIIRNTNHWLINCTLWASLVTSSSSKSDQNNGSPSKNPDIRTPLVENFSLGVFICFLLLARFWCQGFSKDSYYSEYEGWKIFNPHHFCFIWTTKSLLWLGSIKSPFSSQNYWLENGLLVVPKHYFVFINISVSRKL